MNPEPLPARLCAAAPRPDLRASMAFARNSAISVSEELVLAPQRRLVRIDVLLHERAHLGAPLPAAFSAWTSRSAISESLHVLEPGSAVQNAIYLAGGAEWQVSPDDWETGARERLEQGPFDYVAGGAGSEATVRANREAFERRRLRPRMLSGNTERDLSVEVLGLHSPAPFLLGPVGVLSIVHPEAELGVARASKATGVPMVLSSAASTSLEDVAAELGESQRWFQLYWWGDRELAGSLVDRAGAAGYGAIVVTLDTLTLGWRDRDLRNGYLPFLGGEGLAQFFSDPLFRERLDVPPEDDLQTASLMALAAFPNLALTWSDLAWLRERTELPVVLKGILRAEDARPHSTTASTGLSSPTTAAGRSTARSPRSTRSSRCATRSALTRRC